MRAMERMMRFALALLATALASWPAQAAAQAYPARPLRLVIPFPPGGSNDVVGRMIAAETAKWARVVKEGGIRAE
jgi:tripartite-type tricarboxylate transporter receptor subunit TctC